MCSVRCFCLKKFQISGVPPGITKLEIPKILAQWKTQSHPQGWRVIAGRYTLGAGGCHTWNISADVDPPQTCANIVDGYPLQIQPVDSFRKPFERKETTAKAKPKSKPPKKTAHQRMDGPGNTRDEAATGGFPTPPKPAEITLCSK